MKKLLIFLAVCLLSGAFAANSIGDMNKFDGYYFNNGKVQTFKGLRAGVLNARKNKIPSVLLFCGGRPWVASSVGSNIAKAGASVVVVGSANLDGNGGASTKRFLTDKVEPPVYNGIEPALKYISRFNAVVINGMPENLMRSFFTPGRIAAFRKYVENGGILVINNRFPSTVDFAPVKLAGNDANFKNYTAQCPELDVFKDVPRKWQIFQNVKKTTLQPDSKVIIPMLDANGQNANIMLAERTLGKGKVIFINGDFTRTTGTRQMFNWAYGRCFLNACIAYAGLKLDPGKVLWRKEAPPASKQLGKITLDVRKPFYQVKTVNKTPVKSVVNGKTFFTFGDKSRLEINSDGSVNFYRPDNGSVLYKNMIAPEMISQRLRNVSEAELNEDITKSVVGKIKVKWILTDTNIKNNAVVLTYKSDNGDILVLNYQVEEVRMDERKYNSLAVSAEVLKSKNLVQTFDFKSTLVTDGQKPISRSHGCYRGPRGYYEFKFAAKKHTEANHGGFFGSGQPFVYISTDKEIYSGYPDAPMSSSFRHVSDNAGKTIDQILRVNIGRRKAPVKIPAFRYLYSKGAENGNAEYLAHYQYVRKHLREKAGIKPMYPVTAANSQNTCTREEHLASWKLAAKVGFKDFFLNWCPSPIEGLSKENTLKTFRTMKEIGINPVAWTAGDYCHGVTEEIFKNTSWYIRNEKGVLYQYGGGHPVIDLQNKEFQKWYKNVISAAVDAGLKGIYLDMGGAATGNVNYATPESATGLSALVDIYKFYQSKGLSVRLEGMSPLILDCWWFRPDKYQSFVGKEFAMVGSNPGTWDLSGPLALDYFRTSMYGCFYPVSIDGMVTNFDRLPGELETVKNIFKLVPEMNKALDHVGMQYITETPFGTLWMSDKGGALFFYDSVKELKLNLPSGWSIKGVKGNVLKNIPRQSVILLNAK